MKIVIGYDGSEAANRALKDLVNAGLPRLVQARIIQAVPPLLPLESLAPAGESVTWYAEAYKTAMADHKVVMDGAKAKSREAAALLEDLFPSWKVSARTLVDVPARAILDAAEAWKADLIVVGSTGWNAFSKLILGSVADNVIKHAHCTVRLGRRGAQSKSHPPRLLIAFDGSPYAEEAVRQIASRAWPEGTEAKVLAVSEFQLHLGDMAVALNRTLGLKHGRTSPWPGMEKKLARAAEQLARAGIRAATVMSIDEPRRGILAEARKMKADAIVMGTHGLSGLDRFFLGSVSASVAAHAPCTVEIARARAKRARK
ncbi:MAG TPA: universal stress protein [Fibrobacteria bacterium]|nr:universal stress protein [Fibrobacteria bacterium]